MVFNNAVACFALFLFAASTAMAQKPAGFPIGIYEMPKTDAELKAMSEAGINLVRCSGAADLDRAAALRMKGWVSIPMQRGADAALESAVRGVMDHPALAVWEGPDEIVWGFTAYSQLYKKGVFPTRGEWRSQTPLAIKYSEEQASIILPKLNQAAALIRKLDRGRHPIWINEAAESDMKFMREYIDAIDITGCDSYPIHDAAQKPAAVADFTDRFHRIGKGRPVWMVLQGFAWGLLTDREPEPVRYPTFQETRMMAWAAIAHGAKSILYWGSHMVPSDSPFRESMYAMTSELAALEPFLAAPEFKGLKVELTESTGRAQPDDRGVRMVARRSGNGWLVALVNEDASPHMGVEVMGIDALNGTQLVELYGTETASVRNGGFVTRLMPWQVKVFATDRAHESPRRLGREFTR
jgi:hypothetical protein